MPTTNGTSMSEDQFKEQPDDTPPSFENVLDELGMPGRFQLTKIIVINNAFLITAFMFMGFLFVGYTPPHVCNTVNDTELLSMYGLQNDSTASIIYGPCDITVSTNQTGRFEDVDKLSCPNGRNFSNDGQTTWITEWDLVCESKGQAEFTYSMFTVGQILGGLISCRVGDRFGRKPIFIACCVGSWLLETTILFAPSIYVVMVIKFGCGFFGRGLVAVGYVYAMEFVAPRHRQVYGVFTSFIWVFFDLILVIVAYALKDYGWEYLQGAGCVAGIVIILCLLLLDESPRWLVANGRVDEAVKILQKASKQNKKDPEKVKELFLAYVDHAFPASSPEPLMPLRKPRIDEKQVDSVDVGVKNEEVSVLALLKHRHLLITTLISTYIWLAHVLTYYGILLTASKLVGDRYLNITLIVMVEFPGCIFVFLMAKRFGRRINIVFFLGITCVSLVASTLFSIFGKELYGADILTTLFFIIGKFAIFSSFSVLYIITPELFPTNLRSTACGFCGSVSRLGGMVAPFLTILYDVVNWGPGLIFTVMSTLAMIMVMLLPETKDKDLPSTIQESIDQRVKRRTKHGMNKPI